MQRVGIFTGVLLLTFSVYFCRAEAKEYTFDFQRVIEVDEGTRLELTYVDGDLQVEGNDEGKLIIEAVKKIHATSMDEAEEVQAHVEIRVRQSRNKITVNTNYLSMRNRGRSFWQKALGIGESDTFGDVDWKISLPNGCDLSVVNTSGTIQMNHVRGAITIRSSSADIALSSLEGPILIENSSGMTSADLLFGDIEIRQPHGKIDLQWVEGDIVVRSSSASIDILQERGTIDLTTSTGSVNIQTNLESARDFYVETESGSIDLAVPLTSSGSLNIASESGEIKTEIPVAIKSMTRKQIKGEFGSGGVKVSLSSISGDVTVAQF